MAFRMWEADKRYRTCCEHSNTAFAVRDRSVSRINSTLHTKSWGAEERKKGRVIPKSQERKEKEKVALGSWCASELHIPCSSAFWARTACEALAKLTSQRQVADPMISRCGVGT